jgi:hypothetical protein
MKRRPKDESLSNGFLTNAITARSKPILAEVIARGENPNGGCVVGVDFSGKAGRSFVVAAARANGVPARAVEEQMDQVLSSKAEPPLHVHWYESRQLAHLLIEVFGEHERDLQRRLVLERAPGRARMVAINDKGLRTWDALYTVSIDDQGGKR